MSRALYHHDGNDEEATMNTTLHVVNRPIAINDGTMNDLHLVNNLQCRLKTLLLIEQDLNVVTIKTVVACNIPLS